MNASNVCIVAWVNKHRVAVKRIGGALLACLAVSAMEVNNAHATNISASSNGNGLQVNISALGMNLAAGPLPSNSSGTAPAPYNLNNNVANVNVTAGVPVVVSGAVTATTVNGAAFSNVDALSGSRTTSAAGGVVGANINTTTIPAIGPGLNLLGLNGTLSSTAQITGDFGALSALGTTTIQSLGLTITGIPVNLSAFVGVPIAPNTSVNLAALGIANASLILNEQIIAPDNHSITVNALDLSLNLANISGSVVLGHSQAQVTAVPEPASAVLLGLGLLGTVIAKRRFFAPTKA